MPDAEVATALRIIRNHCCCEPMTVEAILDEVAISRRSLENRFHRLVGRSPHAEIIRCRLERAKQLLTETDLPIKAMAARVGVGTPDYLSALFRRGVGMIPTAYRGTHQPGRGRSIADVRAVAIEP